MKPTTTKREVCVIGKIYDPLGLVSPTTIVAKILYRKMCDNKLPWDGELPEEIKKRLVEWQNELRAKVTVPRTLTPVNHQITAVHGFGDTSKNGVSAAVYAVVQQGETTTQGLVCSKSRLAKMNLSIPRL